jgi:cell division protein FtsB
MYNLIAMPDFVWQIFFVVLLVLSIYFIFQTYLTVIQLDEKLEERKKKKDLKKEVV